MDEERNLNPTDAQEQFALAQAYYYGRGLAQDFTKALYWYEKAAEQGHAEAVLEAARMIYTGTGMDSMKNRDPERAISMLQKQAEQGNIAARFDLEFYVKRTMESPEEKDTATLRIPTTCAIAENTTIPKPGCIICGQDIITRGLEGLRRRIIIGL